MCNCGNKRNTYTQQQHANNANTNVANSEMPFGKINFEYTGKTALTVKGSVTGITYRFTYPGDIKTVDVRDASTMLLVPALRKKAPEVKTS